PHRGRLASRFHPCCILSRLRATPRIIVSRGATRLTVRSSTPRTLHRKAFCPHCGTAIYATSTGDEPKAYNVRVGALRQRNELVPRRQIFVRSQQTWVNDFNSIPKFEGMPH